MSKVQELRKQFRELAKQINCVPFKHSQHRGLLLVNKTRGHGLPQPLDPNY